MVGLRLIAPRFDSSWSAPEARAEGDDAAAPLAAACAEGADWVRGQLKSARLPPRLAAVCLDADGALTAWLRTPAAGRAAVPAEVQRGLATPEEALDDDAPSELSLSADAASSARASVTALAEAAGPRVGVLATPDLAARLLLDQLDSAGVAVDRVLSVFHALAEAWDPGRADAGTTRGERVVATAGATTAAIIAPDDSGRWLWTWSRAGALVASGSCRARSAADNGHTHARLDRAALARFAADWVAWGPQLGLAPARVVALLPAGSWDDSTTSLASALRSAWPEATVDLVEIDQPVDTALERLADPQAPQLGPGLPALTSRPGRAHRALHRWMGLAMLGAAAALAALAWRLHGSVGSIRSESGQARSQWRELAASLDERALEPGAGDPLLFLTDELAAQRSAFRPVEAVRPIMRELEALALVLSDASSFTLVEIAIDSSNARVELGLPDIETYEAVQEALRSIGGSTLAEWQGTPTSRGNEIRGTFFARWPEVSRP